MHVDINNIEFQRAYHLVAHTDRNVFLTGRAGTGKTTFLKYLKAHCNKSMAIVAPTGVAAINAGGVTIHSFFQITPGFNAPNALPAYDFNSQKRAVIAGLELLIIDEVSMVRCDLLEMIDKTCKLYGNEKKAFGGKQVLFIGDPYQLPPFVSKDEQEVFFKFYHSTFFFKTQVFWDTKPIPIELKKIYRQNDKTFIDLLNQIRINEVSENELALLNQKVVGEAYPYAKEKYLCLATKNDDVKAKNQIELEKLSSKLHQMTGQITGDFPASQLPTELVLQLKEGAQVMFVKNDSGAGNRYYNGKLGIIDKIQGDKIEVAFPEGGHTYVDRVTWEKIKYEWDEKEKKVIEKIDGTFTQFPLRLAWAITVHKSQGLSLDRVFADVSNSWGSGQVYVAISRCTTFEGLKLAKRIPREAIRVDLEVQEFYKWVLQQTSLQDQPPKIITFQANKVILTEPDSITIEWKVEGAQSVSLGGKNNLPAEGSLIVWPKKERAYELIARNDFGVIAKETIEIQVKDTPPVIYHFTTDKAVLTDNTPARLTWQVEGADKIEIIGIGDVTDKQEEPFFSQRDRRLILRAESYFGMEVTRSIQISVSKAPPTIEIFEASQQYILRGMPIEFLWKVVNAEKINILPIQFENKAASGRHPVTVYESTIFQLTAWSYFGVAAHQTITIHVLPIPIIESLLVPNLSIDTRLNIDVERPLLPNFSLDSKMPLVKIEPDYFIKPITTNSDYGVSRTFPDLRALFETLKLSVANQLQILIEQFKK